MSLEDVYWIGGGSGAGKSAVARRVAAEHGLEVYATDDVMSDHAARSASEDVPYLRAFERMDMDERWVRRSPAAMLDTFHWFRGEAFGLILEDLRRLSAAGGVVAEGFRLLPHLVRPVSRPGRAIWLLPSPSFRARVFERRRGTRLDFAAGTSMPDVARANLLERDRLFTDRLAMETRRLGLPAIHVSAGTTEDAVAALVTRAFGL